MKRDFEFLKSVYEELPVPCIFIDKGGNCLAQNEAFKKNFPAFGKESSVSFLIPQNVVDKILSQDKVSSSYILGINTTITSIPFPEGFLLQFIKGEEDPLKDSLMASLLIPVPHIFRSSISEMLVSVSALYAIGEENEDERICEIAKKLNLSSYNILRGNNLVSSYCRELVSSCEDGEIINLSEFLRTASEAARVIANDSGIGVDIDIKDDTVKVKCCETSLLEAILCVIDNSVKYSEKGKHIKITLSRKDSRAVLMIKDEGIGIPGDIMGNIFKPYFSFTREKVPFSGVGLGLTLARLIFLKWGGNISVSSKDYEGTTVVMTLPVCENVKKTEFNSKITLASLLRDRFSPLHVIFSDNGSVPLP